MLLRHCPMSPRPRPSSNSFVALLLSRWCLPLLGKKTIDYDHAILYTALPILTICDTHFIMTNSMKNVTNSYNPLEAVRYPRLWSKSRYKCFEAFDGLIRRKNFTNSWSVKKHFKAFAASRWPYSKWRNRRTVTENCVANFKH